jgi:hypothetical protein
MLRLSANSRRIVFLLPEFCTQITLCEVRGQFSAIDLERFQAAAFNIAAASRSHSTEI